MLVVMDQKHVREPSSTSAAQTAQCQCPKIFPDIVGLTRTRCVLRGAGDRNYSVGRDEGYGSAEFGKIKIRALHYSKCELPSLGC